MELIKVDSSNIKAVGYENTNLFVQYNSGVYVYENVPKELYEALLKAESKGRFMSESIKGKYKYFKQV